MSNSNSVARQISILKGQVYSEINKANKNAPVERHITPKSAFTVVQRSLESSMDLPFEVREFRAMRELASFVSLSQENKFSDKYDNHTDLLPISHPSSSRAHAMTASALRTARLRWVLSDLEISDEAKPLLASAFSSEEDSLEHKYAITRLEALPAGSIPLEVLVAAFKGDGNSYMARRLRAMKQRRDRLGQFAEEGGGLRSLIRRLNGDVHWLSGRVVGADPNSDTFDVEYSNGLIARVPAAKSDSFQAYISNGSKDGYSPKTANIDSSDMDSVINEDAIQYVDAPYGWSLNSDFAVADNEKAYSDEYYTVVKGANPDGTFSFRLVDQDGDVVSEGNNWSDMIESSAYDAQNNATESTPIARIDETPDAEPEVQAEDDSQEFKYTYPDGVYQLAENVSHTPGLDEAVNGSVDYTDDPVELAALLQEQGNAPATVFNALKQALLPSGGEATGYGFLTFHDEDDAGVKEPVSAEALYKTLEELKVDAQKNTAKLYDAVLGEKINETNLMDSRSAVKAEKMTPKVAEPKAEIKPEAEVNPEVKYEKNPWDAGIEVKPDFTPENPKVESLSPGKEWSWVPDEYGASGKTVIEPGHWGENERARTKRDAFTEIVSNDGTKSARGYKLIEKAKLHGLEDMPVSPPEDVTSRTATSPNGDWMWVPLKSQDNGGAWSFSEQGLQKTNNKNTEARLAPKEEVTSSELGGTFETDGLSNLLKGKLKAHLDKKIKYKGEVMTNEEFYKSIALGKRSFQTWTFPEGAPDGGILSKVKYALVSDFNEDGQVDAQFDVPKIVFDAFKPNSGKVIDSTYDENGVRRDQKPEAEISTPEVKAPPSMKQIIDRVKEDEGLSIKPIDGSEPDSGYISAVRWLNKEVPEDVFFGPEGEDILAQYIIDNADALSAGDEFYLGLWHDKKNNQVVLDVAENIMDRDEAIQAGIDRNQQSIYDVVARDIIDTGGTGDREETDEAGNNTGETTEASKSNDGGGDSGVGKKPTSEDGGRLQQGQVEPKEIEKVLPAKNITPIDEEQDVAVEDTIPDGPVNANKLPVTDGSSDEFDFSDESFPPTEQQLAVLKAVTTGEDVVVRALAGTGKTSTLKLIARTLLKKDKNKKIIYVAFNKSIQLEADATMPDNVESRTADSLAWRAISKKLTDKKKTSYTKTLPKAKDLANHFGIGSMQNPDNKEETLSGADVTQIVRRAIENYCISADDTISDKHFNLTTVPPQLLDLAGKFWTDINSPDGVIPFTNSHATKIWALGKPDFSKTDAGLSTPANVIFFDEAQDINPVLAKVIADQNIQKVYVGDENQAIYAFRGAEDELQNVKAKYDLPLTKSWRFGPQVAGMGNRFLTLLGSKNRVEGGGPEGEIVAPDTMEDADAILVRSNGGAVQAIMDEIGRGRTVGVSEAYKTELTRLIDTAAWLKYSGNKPYAIHEDLAPYSSWEEVKKAVDKGESAKVTMLYNMVENNGISEIRSLLDQVQVVKNKEDAAPEGEFIPAKIEDVAEGKTGALSDKLNYTVTGGNVYVSGKSNDTFAAKDMLKSKGFKWDKEKKQWYKPAVSDEERLTVVNDVRKAAGGFEEPTKVDVVVTTTHKAKGLEWDRVRIFTDFWGPKKNKETGEIEMPSDEEMRLAYVAVTRAKKVLDPGALAWVYDYTSEADEKPIATPSIEEGTAPDISETISEPNESKPSVTKEPNVEDIVKEIESSTPTEDEIKKMLDGEGITEEDNIDGDVPPEVTSKGASKAARIKANAENEKNKINGIEEKPTEAPSNPNVESTSPEGDWHWVPPIEEYMMDGYWKPSEKQNQKILEQNPDDINSKLAKLLMNPNSLKNKAKEDETPNVTGWEDELPKPAGDGSTTPRRLITSVGDLKPGDVLVTDHFTVESVFSDEESEKKKPGSVWVTGYYPGHKSQKTKLWYPADNREVYRDSVVPEKGDLSELSKPDMKSFGKLTKVDGKWALKDPANQDSYDFAKSEYDKTLAEAMGRWTPPETSPVEDVSSIEAGAFKTVSLPADLKPGDITYMTEEYHVGKFYDEPFTSYFVVQSATSTPDENGKIIVTGYFPGHAPQEKPWNSTTPIKIVRNEHPDAMPQQGDKGELHTPRLNQDEKYKDPETGKVTSATRDMWAEDSKQYYADKKAAASLYSDAAISEYVESGQHSQPEKSKPTAKKQPWKPDALAFEGEKLKNIIRQADGDPVKLKELLDKETITYFDFETDANSGFGPDTNPIQIAAHKILNGEIVDSFTAFMNPGNTLGNFYYEAVDPDKKNSPPKLDENGNKILKGDLKTPDGEPVSDEWLKEQQSIEEGMKKFFDWLGDEPILAGHNAARFDEPILDYQADKTGSNYNPAGLIDTLPLARSVITDGSNHRLGTLTARYGVQLDNWHDAEADSMAVKGVFDGILDEMSKTGAGTDHLDIDAKQEEHHKTMDNYYKQLDEFKASKNPNPTKTVVDDAFKNPEDSTKSASEILDTLIAENKVGEAISSEGIVNSPNGQAPDGISTGPLSQDSPEWIADDENTTLIEGKIRPDDMQVGDFVPSSAGGYQEILSIQESDKGANFLTVTTRLVGSDQTFTKEWFRYNKNFDGVRRPNNLDDGSHAINEEEIIPPVVDETPQEWNGSTVKVNSNGVHYVDNLSSSDAQKLRTGELTPPALPFFVPRYANTDPEKGDGDFYSVSGKRYWGQFGASGVVIRRKNADGKYEYLLGKRSASLSTGGNQWAYPGGAIQDLEDKNNPIKTALDELEEEAGIDLHGKVAPSLKFVDDIESDWAYTTFIADASSVAIGDGPTSGDGENSEWGWFTGDQLNEMATDGSLFAPVAKNMGALLSLSEDNSTNEEVVLPGSASDAPSIKELDSVFDVSKWTLVDSNIGGSNGASLYMDRNGNSYVVKYPKSDTHAANEVLASAFYDEAGVLNGRVLFGKDKDGKTVLVSPWIEDSKGDFGSRLSEPDIKKSAQEGFILDAWLNNWDSVGLTYDNMVTVGDKVYRIDPGASLLFRAQGADKKQTLTPDVSQIDSLRDPSINPQAAKVFGDMTDKDMAESAKFVEAITPEKINELVDKIFADDKENADFLKERLIARREDIINRFKGDNIENTPPIEEEITSEKEKSEFEKIGADLADEEEYQKDGYEFFSDWDSLTIISNKPNTGVFITIDDSDENGDYAVQFTDSNDNTTNLGKYEDINDALDAAMSHLDKGLKEYNEANKDNNNNEDEYEDDDIKPPVLESKISLLDEILKSASFKDETKGLDISKIGTSGLRLSDKDTKFVIAITFDDTTGKYSVVTNYIDNQVTDFDVIDAGEAGSPNGALRILLSTVKSYREKYAPKTNEKEALEKIKEKYSDSSFWIYGDNGESILSTAVSATNSPSGKDTYITLEKTESGYKVVLSDGTGSDEETEDNLSFDDAIAQFIKHADMVDEFIKAQDASSSTNELSEAQHLVAIENLIKNNKNFAGYIPNIDFYTGVFSLKDGRGNTYTVSKDDKNNCWEIYGATSDDPYTPYFLGTQKYVNDIVGILNSAINPKNNNSSEEESNDISDVLDDVISGVTLDVSVDTLLENQKNISDAEKKITDPNIVLSEIKNDNPDHKVLDNGHIVVSSRTVDNDGSFTYETRVIRNADETFTVYGVQRDDATGEEKFILYKGGNRRHSYEAIKTKIIQMNYRFSGNDPRAKVKSLPKSNVKKSLQDFSFFKPEDFVPQGTPATTNAPGDVNLSKIKLPKTRQPVMDAYLTIIEQAIRENNYIPTDLFESFSGIPGMDDQKLDELATIANNAVKKEINSQEVPTGAPVEVKNPYVSSDGITPLVPGMTVVYQGSGKHKGMVGVVTKHMEIKANKYGYGDYVGVKFPVNNQAYPVNSAKLTILDENGNPIEPKVVENSTPSSTQIQQPPSVIVIPEEQELILNTDGAPPSVADILATHSKSKKDSSFLKDFGTEDYDQFIEAAKQQSILVKDAGGIVSGKYLFPGMIVKDSWSDDYAIVKMNIKAGAPDEDKVQLQWISGTREGTSEEVLSDSVKSTDRALNTDQADKLLNAELDYLTIAKLKATVKQNKADKELLDKEAAEIAALDNTPNKLVFGSGVPPVEVAEHIDWSHTDFEGLPTLDESLERVKKNSKDARHGIEILSDSDSIEDGKMSVQQIINLDGEKKTRLTLKLTPWTANKLVSSLDESTAIPFLSLTKFEVVGGNLREDGIWAEGTYYGIDGRHEGQTFKIDLGNGSYALLHRANKDDKSPFFPTEVSGVSNAFNPTPVALHDEVEIYLGENATTDDVTNALKAVGVSSARPATKDDVKILMENKVLSIFSKKGASSNNYTGESREKMLTKIKKLYGIDASDVIPEVGSNGRDIHYLLPKEVGEKLAKSKKIVAFKHRWESQNTPFNVDEKIDFLFNFITESSMASTTDRWMNGVNVVGQSSSKDINGPGANYVYTSAESHLPSPNSGSSSYWEFWYDGGEMFRRLDYYANEQDSYGVKKKYNQFDKLDNGSYEIPFKSKIDWSSLSRLNIDTAIAQKLYDKFVSEGITHIGGRPIAEILGIVSP